MFDVLQVAIDLAQLLQARISIGLDRMIAYAVYLYDT